MEYNLGSGHFTHALHWTLVLVVWICHRLATIWNGLGINNVTGLLPASGSEWGAHGMALDYKIYCLRSFMFSVFCLI